MNELRIELPPDVRAAVARRAGGDPAAEAAWVADAVRERLAALAELEYLEAGADRGSREAFERCWPRRPRRIRRPRISGSRNAGLSTVTRRGNISIGTGGRPSVG